MNNEEEVIAEVVKGAYVKSLGKIPDWLNQHYRETPSRPGDQWWYMLSAQTKKLYLDTELTLRNS